MRELINRAANEFERRFGTTVDGAGRRELLTPALPHTDDVAKALAAGSITISFLEECVISILERADRILQARGGSSITGSDVVASMQEDCPYFFWC